MSPVQAEQRKKPLRINENKIRSLEITETEDLERREDNVAPTRPVAVNASGGHRPSF